MGKGINKKIVFLVIFFLIVSAIVVIGCIDRDVILEKTDRFFNSYDVEKTTEVGIGDIDFDTSNVEFVEDTAGVKVPVPKGYVASNADGEHTVNTGFVIYEGSDEVTTENAWEESKKRNQWVWVPVSDPSRIYVRDSTTGKIKSKLYNFSKSETATERTSKTNSNYEPGLAPNYDRDKYFLKYNLPGMTRNQLLHDLEVELEATVKSIEKYGGFYIGRYETGNVTTSKSYKEPVVQRLNENINYVSWYHAYSKLGNLAANSNVKTNIIWGCLWDETMQWLMDTEDKTYDEIAKDSKDWGNYNDISFDYITVSGETKTKGTGGTRVPTGSAERNKSNNIYDLAGNMAEWTLEADGAYVRRLRGGRCNVTGAYWPAGDCNSSYPYSSSDSYRCACVLLY